MEIVERRIREVVVVDQMRFGFMSGRVTTGALFVVRKMLLRNIKRKILYLYFADVMME